MSPAHTKGNSQSHLDDHERRLDRKTSKHDFVLGAIEDAESQILGTDQDGADKVARTVAQLAQLPSLSNRSKY